MKLKKTKTRMEGPKYFMKINICIVYMYLVSHGSKFRLLGIKSKRPLEFFLFSIC